MAGKAFTVQVDMRDALKGLNLQQQGAKRAVDSMCRDMRKRGPGIVADEVRTIYNIKKKYVMHGNKGAGELKVRITSNTIDDFKIEYKGKHIVPSKEIFSLSPSNLPGKNYKLRMTVKRGSRAVIGQYKNTRTRNGPYANRTGALLMKEREGGQRFPERRLSRDAKDINYFSTVSVPQMISNKKILPVVEEKMGKKANELLEHHLQRFCG